MSSKTLREEYPIHWFVWHNNYAALDKELAAQKEKLNQDVVNSIDPRGRTPLQLAVTLGHLESVRVLLRNGADANTERNYWSVLQEATCTGDPEIVQSVLQHRDYKRHTDRTQGIPELLQILKEAPDFYVEMKWEFTSWIPLVSRMCPSDTYKVYKSGANVRIDTTLLGFDNTKWERGNRSYVFQGKVNQAKILEIDHDVHSVYSETVHILPTPRDVSVSRPSADAVAVRLTSPVNTTYIDTNKIAFERSKSGIWGWRSDKVENVGGYECKVFSASNVEVVTKTRTEHLTEQDKANSQKNSRMLKSPLETFLTKTEKERKAVAPELGEEFSVSTNPCHITPEEYFNKHVDLGERDIGRPKDIVTKTQKFKATLSLCEDYPLSLQEQVLPIIDIMAQTNAHFQKLKDFITLQLPAGFPVKIEIPLFYVLDAKITFGNIYAMDKPVTGVTYIKSDEDNKMMCIVDESVFECPAGYEGTGIGETSRHVRLVRDEDDELLQFAIQQSLVDSGTEDDQVTFLEALDSNRATGKQPIHSNISRPLPSAYRWDLEDQELQRALEQSLACQAQNAVTDYPESVQLPTDETNDLKRGLKMSESNEETDRQRQQEDEQLEMILKLSLSEK